MVSKDAYKDPRWQKRRLEIMERDGFSCFNCGDTTSTLHVHHISYGKTLWGVPDNELQTLCETCHGRLPKHPKGGVWYMLVKDLGETCFAWRHCPECGSKKLQDKGSFDKCRDCGCRIELIDD